MASRKLYLRRFSAPLWGCLLLCTMAEARPWTSSDGKTVEAEFVEFSADGEGIILDIQGRRFTVPLDRLSEADQAYAAELRSSENGGDATTPEAEADRTSEDLSSELREPRIWTARDGTTIRARLIRISSGTILFREDDRSRRVRFYDLSLADRQFLAKAFAAMGQSEQVPPVRPELIDLVVEAPAPPADAASEEDAPAASQPSDSPPQPMGEKTEVSLPPSGFGSMDSEASREPATESPAEPADDIVLPPSGFGSVEEEEPEAAPRPESSEPSDGFGSDVVLPPSGFGSIQESTAGSADEFFDEAGNQTPGEHVQVPQSTIPEDEMLPPSGFGSAPPEVALNEPDATTIPAPQASRESTGTPAEQPASTTVSPRRPANNPSYTQQRNPPPAPPIAAPAELSGAQWNLRLFGILLLSGGCLLFSTSYLWLIALAFYEGYREGLRRLIPGTAILLTVTDAEQSNTPLMTMMLGICLALGGSGLLLS